MTKAILMSIKPEHLVKILNGEKTIEIRKTMPKCKLPIDVYLYCTKNGKPLLRLPTNDKKEWFLEAPYGWVVDKKTGFNGRVVAKFTLHKIERISLELIDKSGYDEDKLKSYETNSLQDFQVEEKSCLTDEEIDTYLNSGVGYAWHIDNLTIFDKPKELSDLFTQRPIYNKDKTIWGWLDYKLTRAPQSWQYVWVKE